MMETTERRNEEQEEVVRLHSIWEENRVVGRVFSNGGKERRVIRRMWRIIALHEKTVTLRYVFDAVAQQVFCVPTPDPQEIEVDRRALLRWFHR